MPLFAPVEVTVEPAADGVIVRSRMPLGPIARCVGDWLESWAERAPDRVFLGERRGDGWRTVTYAEAHRVARGIGAALVARGVDRPIALLSENGIDHALLQLGGIGVGVPVAPVSPAYALQSTAFERLRSIAALLRPQVVFAADPARFGPALRATGLDRALVLDGAGVLALGDTAPSAASDRATAAVGSDTVAKILFTSGSTGNPKGVVNTQRMLCSNQQAIAQAWPFLADEPPVTVDWLPWSHTFGGNHNLFMILRNGGTMWIDGGRPAPGLVERTIDNLRTLTGSGAAPTVYFNVPRGYELLVGPLEQDPGLRAAFFSRLRVLFYAAAALPPPIRSRLLAVAGGSDTRFASAWGSTETSPMSTTIHGPTDTPGCIGVPAAGTAIKLARVDDKLELRVRGPNVTPGYWTDGGPPEPPPLDADGFLHTGDAARLDDPDRPERGFVFEGRLGENFKLTSGTWVRVGPVRLALIASCAPDVSDAVIAGEGRDELGALLFLAPGVDRDGLRERLRAALIAHRARHPASSEAITRVVVQSSPPSLDAGETTDKGYLNQRRVLDHRRDEVERLFAAGPADPDVIVV